MFRTCKEVSVKKGQLYATVSGNRYVFAECKGNVELKEELQEVPCLGYRNAVTRRFATLLVTFKHKVKKVDIKNLELISFKGEFIAANGDSVILSFTRCLPMDELDLTEKGINKFEVICSPEIINKLLAI